MVNNYRLVSRIDKNADCFCEVGLSESQGQHASFVFLENYHEARIHFCDESLWWVLILASKKHLHVVGVSGDPQDTGPLLQVWHRNNSVLHYNPMPALSIIEPEQS
jgi:hypothetical protein